MSKTREFFRSDAMSDFHEKYSSGEAPAGAVLDAVDRIVITNFDRTFFYILSNDGENVSAHVTEDALQVIDPESESLDVVGTYSDAATALEAVLTHEAKHALTSGGHDSFGI